MISPATRAALDELVARDDPSILGLVLSGSAARGMETERSDVDVFVVRDDEVERETLHNHAIDEIPIALADLESVPPYGTSDWWFRWSFAYAAGPPRRDRRPDRRGRTPAGDGRPGRAAVRSLVDHDRLDGWVNFAYRSLKSDRDGRPLESRLDAVESVPWLMDVVFTLAGRVRPYNKYLPWELREHPLAVPEWSAEAFLPEIERMLAGDPTALRAYLRGG